jgi:hypothetical protein
VSSSRSRLPGPKRRDSRPAVTRTAALTVNGQEDFGHPVQRGRVRIHPTDPAAAALVTQNFFRHQRTRLTWDLPAGRRIHAQCRG